MCSWRSTAVGKRAPAVLRSVFTKSLSEQLRPLTWWALGIASLNVLVMLFYPAVADRPEINDIIESLGPAFESVFTGQIEDFTSPEGFVQSRLFTFLHPLLFIALGIVLGSGAVAGEEERGTLDLLLSNPLNRWRVVAEKFAAGLGAMAVMAAGSWAGMAIGALIVSMEIGYGRLAEATASAALLGTVFGTFALALGSWRGKRGTAAGVTAATGVGMYLVNSLAPLADWSAPFGRLSPFHYYSSAKPVFNGIDPVHALVLAGLVAMLAAAALVTFERRDLGTG